MAKLARRKGRSRPESMTLMLQAEETAKLGILVTCRDNLSAKEVVKPKAATAARGPGLLSLTGLGQLLANQARKSEQPAKMVTASLKQF